MRGRRVVEWREDADELRRRYRAERVPEVRARLHGLWLIRAYRAGDGRGARGRRAHGPAVGGLALARTS
jgi:hypothetical protein